MALTYEEFSKLEDRNHRIFKLLNECPMSASELAPKLHLHRGTVSKYLNQLVRQRKLEKRKNGRIVYYGIVKTS